MRIINIFFCQILAFLTCGIILSCKEDNSEFKIVQLTEEEYLAAAVLSDEIKGTTIPNDKIADLPLEVIKKLDEDVRAILEEVDDDEYENRNNEFNYGVRTYPSSFPYVEIFFYDPTEEFSYLIYKDDDGKWAVVPERFESSLFKVSKSGYIASALETNDACFIDMNFHKAELEKDNPHEIREIGSFTTLKELRDDFKLYEYSIVDDGFWLGDDFYLKCYRYMRVEETQSRYYKFSGIGDLPKTQIYIDPSGKYYAVEDKSRTITISDNEFVYKSDKAEKLGYSSDTLAFCSFSYNGERNLYRIWMKDKYPDLPWNKEARKRLLRDESFYDSTLTDKIRVVFDLPCKYRVKVSVFDKEGGINEKVFTSQRDTIFIPSNVRDFTYQIDLAEEIKSVYKDGRHYSPTSYKRNQKLFLVRGKTNSYYIYPYWITNEYFEQDNFRYDTLLIESGKLFWRGEVFEKK